MRRSASTIMLPLGNIAITRADTVAVTLEPVDVSPCPFNVLEELIPRSGLAACELVPGALAMAEFALNDLELFTSPVDEAAVVSDTRSVTTSPRRWAL